MRNVCVVVMALLGLCSFAWADRLIEVPVGGAQTVSMGGVAGRLKITDLSVATVDRFGTDLSLIHI